jgi:hypothetical protein
MAGDPRCPATAKRRKKTLRGVRDLEDIKVIGIDLTRRASRHETRR